ncbi:hypothetical protein ACFC08_20040 [Streptomyces sp. NPDC056112]|uniref:hypothetical protein n=1 Tax=unclassified Streptomyces TaxID=2593676 RepID=UPI001CD474AD|nr:MULTISPECIES: hypothetical protein [unclassified Streptomyces]
MTEQTESVNGTEPVEPTAQDTPQVSSAPTAETQPVPETQPTLETQPVPGTQPVSEAPPLPGTPPPPVEPQTFQAAPEPRPKKDRRVLRAVLRWTAAVVVFGAVGASAAYGITRMERTDVPGLATESDGRWDYPTLVKPPLPSGSPGPFAEANKSGTHYADLRELLLPAPEGARAEAALRGKDGWLPTKTFLAQYADETERGTIAQLLTDYGLRHIAARGWTTPDGTRTRIYLLQFNTAAVADELFSAKLTNYSLPSYRVRGADVSERDEDFPPSAEVDDVESAPYVESKPYGAEQVRQAYLSAGDTIGVIVQSRKGTAPAVPFQQTVTLQSQLLG